MKPKAVVFDLGKVLLHFDWMRAAEKLATRSPVPAAEMLKTLDYNQLVIQYELGNLSSREFFDEVRSAINFSGTFEDFVPMFSEIFTEIPELIRLQEELRQRRVPTFILSNTNELAVNHIRASYPFFAHFDGYALSYEHRAMKPDAKLYEVVESMSGYRNADLLYIDDLPKNIEAARSRGWQVVLQENPKKTVDAVRATGVLE